MKKRFAFDFVDFVEYWRSRQALEEISYGVLRGCEVVAVNILCIFAMHALLDYVHILLALCCA